MADSSFDPLALVKAMGPQTDPYSWAQLYAQDAGKQNALMIELRNRMLAQENQQRFQAGEHEKDRGSRMGIVEYQQRQMNERAKANAKVRSQSIAARAKDIDWPDGSIGEREAETAGILRAGEFDRNKYRMVTRYGITKLIPKDAAPPPMSTYPELTPTPIIRNSDGYDN